MSNIKPGDVFVLKNNCGIPSWESRFKFLFILENKRKKYILSSDFENTEYSNDAVLKHYDYLGNGEDLIELIKLLYV